MISTCSACVPYAPRNETTVINKSNYLCVDSTAASSIETITVQVQPSLTAFNRFYAISFAGIQTYTLEVVNETTGFVLFLKENTSISFPNGTTGSQPEQPCDSGVITSRPNILLHQITVNNNIYQINLASCCDGEQGIVVIFIQNLQQTIIFPINNTLNSISPNTLNSIQSNNLINEKCLSCKGKIISSPIKNISSAIKNNCDCHKHNSSFSNSYHETYNCENVKIPQLNVTIQTTMDGSDVGEANFTVRDTINYTNEKLSDGSIESQICKARFAPADLVVTSFFRECCSFIVSVLCGEGNTAREKAHSIYIENNIVISFQLFFNRIIAYAMIKYILFRLLTGKFNVCYLFGKYNKKFIKKLSCSRFCNFTQIFEDCSSDLYGYNKYFLYDCEL